jgi:LuxR family maltose regulon positive regulatory protein
VPPTGPCYLPRPRLLEALDRAVTTPVTLVVSPAGTGKSTLLAAWASAPAVPVAWFGVDTGDADPVHFWAGVIAALDTIVEGCGAGALAVLADTGCAEPALARLIDDLESTKAGPRVLVLDDVHLADDPVVRATLAELAQNLPAWLHLILASRHVPGIPLARMRVRGDITELRFDELSFSVDEARALLTLITPELSAPEAAACIERADGWVVSLLLELAGRNPRAPAIPPARASAGQDLVHDYVMNEVLAGEDGDVVRVLLDIAVVGRVGAGLAETLSGRRDAEAMLAQAEQRGLFVSRRRPDGWFELHPAVRAALLRQLSKAPPRLTLLHRRAARWFADAGAVAAAFAHHSEAGDSREALRLLAANQAGLCDAGDAAAVRRMVAEIPPDIATVDAAAMLHYAWCHVLVEPAVFVELVGWLTRRLDRGSLRPGERSRIDLMESIVACMSGDWARSGQLARSALAQLGENPCRDAVRCFGWTMAARQAALSEEWDDNRGDIRRIDFSLSADPRRRLELEGIRMLGDALAGRPLEALRLAAGVRRAADIRHRANLVADVTIAEAIAQREVGERERAVDALGSLASAQAGSFSYSRLLALAELVDAAVDHGDLIGAEADLGRALALISVQDGPGLRDRVARAATRLALAKGDVDGARRWAATTTDGFWRHVGSARVHLADGDRPAALEALQEARPRSARHDVVLALVRARATRCPEEAASLVGGAIDAASANGMVQTVASEGDVVGRLIEAVAWRMPETWIERLRRATSAATAAPVRPVGAPEGAGPLRDASEALTVRERDVLRFLPSRLTWREVAGELGVSVNTLQFHLKVIYRKLGVTSRADAASVARRLTLSHASSCDSLVGGLGAGDPSRAGRPPAGGRPGPPGTSPGDAPTSRAEQLRLRGAELGVGQHALLPQGDELLQGRGHVVATAGSCGRGVRGGGRRGVGRGRGRVGVVAGLVGILLGPPPRLAARDAVGDGRGRAGDHRRAGHAADESHRRALRSRALADGVDRRSRHPHLVHELPPGVLHRLDERRRPDVLDGHDRHRAVGRQFTPDVLDVVGVEQAAAELPVEIHERGLEIRPEVGELQRPDLALRVLVHEEDVDDAHDVAHDEVHERGTDLALELVAGKLQEDQVDWPTSHHWLHDASILSSELPGILAARWVTAPHPQEGGAPAPCVPRPARRPRRDRAQRVPPARRPVASAPRRRGGSGPPRHGRAGAPGEAPGW